MPCAVVIADDLTGANDAGLQFARAGLRTVVALSALPVEADVIVVNTQSRSGSVERAGALAGAAAARYADHLLYQKMDSTARGHFAVELAAIMGVTNRRLALVVPSFPALGRTVRAGRVLVDGIPLEETPFARDPTFPTLQSHLPTILGAAGLNPILPVPLAMVEQGPAWLAEALKDFGAGVAVCDAETDAHLSILAGAAALLTPVPVLCGSAGLAAALPGAFRWPPKTAAASIHATGPALVLAGSRNPVTRRQCEVARDAGASLVAVAAGALLADPQQADAYRALVDVLAAGHVAILTLAPDDALLPDMAPHIAVALAQLALRVAATGLAGALVLTGGDMAHALCRQADVQAIALHDEILPGIPAGRLIGGPYDGLPVATKAGGFGSETALTQIIAYFGCFFR